MHAKLRVLFNIIFIKNLLFIENIKINNKKIFLNFKV